MNKYIRIVYVENGELKKVQKEVKSIQEALDELGKVIHSTVTEFSFFHN